MDMRSSGGISKPLARVRSILFPPNYPYFSRLLLMLAVLTYFMGGYFAIAYFNLSRNTFYDVRTIVDAWIPLTPDFAPLYLLVFLLAGLLYVACPDLQSIRQSAKAITALCTMSFIVFLLVPARIMEPRAVVDDGSWPVQILLFFHWLDEPVNLFPSLHVAMSYLVAWICGSFNRALGFIVHVLAGLVLMTVLLIKQHYFLDVVSGLAFAYLSYRYVYLATESFRFSSAWSQILRPNVVNRDDR